MDSAPLARRRPGRPVSFDRDDALEQAMLLFWRHGYEGTSLKALTAAMGVAPPSLYAAFGDKRRLFLAAVDRYLGAGDVAGPTARAAAQALLHGAVTRFTGDCTPPGCLVASAATSGSPESADIQAALARVRARTGDALRDAIAHDVAIGALPPGTDAEALAGHVMAVLQGLSTLARDGAPRERLLRVVEVAMAAWPPTPCGGDPAR